jgi:hypothetical protein
VKMMKPQKLNKDPDFSLYNWGTDQIDLSEDHIRGEFVPVECHIKMDGTKDNKPCILFVVEDAVGNRFAHQISLKMFQPVLDEIKRIQDV